MEVWVEVYMKVYEVEVWVRYVCLHACGCVYMHVDVSYSM